MSMLAMQGQGMRRCSGRQAGGRRSPTCSQSKAWFGGTALGTPSLPSCGPGVGGNKVAQQGIAACAQEACTRLVTTKYTGGFDTLLACCLYFQTDQGRDASCIGGMTNATDDMYIGRSRQTHSAFGTPSLQLTCCVSAAWMCLWQPCTWNGAAECCCFDLHCGIVC